MVNPNDVYRRRPLGQPAPAPTPESGQAAPALDRIQFGNSIRYSGTHPNARLVALTLLSMADRTGQIPAAHQPDIRRLRGATGLPQAMLTQSLAQLERGGWLLPRADDQAPFVLAVPPGHEERRPRRGSHST